MKIVDNFRWLFEMTFNLQYGKVLSRAFCSHFLIYNDFLQRNGKTQTNSFFGTISKYIFMQRSTFFNFVVVVFSYTIIFITKQQRSYSSLAISKEILNKLNSVIRRYT